MYKAKKWSVTAMGEALRSELRQMHGNTGIRVTLIEPGMTDTEFFDDRPENALADDDIARTVMFAPSEADHVDTHELLIRRARWHGHSPPSRWSLRSRSRRPRTPVHVL